VAAASAGPAIQSQRPPSKDRVSRPDFHGLPPVRRHRHGPVEKRSVPAAADRTIVWKYCAPPFSLTVPVGSATFPPPATAGQHAAPPNATLGAVSPLPPRHRQVEVRRESRTMLLPAAGVPAGHCSRRGWPVAWAGLRPASRYGHRRCGDRRRRQIARWHAWPGRSISCRENPRFPLRAGKPVIGWVIR